MQAEFGQTVAVLPNVELGRRARRDYMPTEQDYRVDGEGRALYYRDYRNTFDRLKAAGILKSGELLPTDLPILFVGNNTIQPQSFDVRKADANAIEGFPYPGKSATIKFTDDRDTATMAIFDRPARRDKNTDHLYAATVGQLEALGFNVYYLPLFNNPLHVRIVHQSHMENPNDLFTARFHKATVALAELLQGQRLPE